MHNIGLETIIEKYNLANYYIRLMFIGSLILGISNVPSNLYSFVKEARENYALGNYNAVFSLCRTIIEISMKDIINKKKIRHKDGRIIDIKDDPITTLINSVSRGVLNQKLKTLYFSKTSAVIHGWKKIDKEEEARELLKDTLKVIQELYSFHGY
jgi:hypothetical protein